MRSPLASYSAPESRALLAARAAARELEYLAGQIGEATFLRSLMNYGASLPEARHALWSLQQGDNSL